MKKLSLKKETLAELTSDQLRVVFGGAANSDSCSCTSCDCSCYAASCIAFTLTDSVTCVVTELTAKYIDVNC